jgi:CO/xanthine dehydrogenase Mo-binding subunit
MSSCVVRCSSRQSPVRRWSGCNIRWHRTAPNSAKCGAPDGARGIGEIGITGAAACVANAVHQATGKRIRKLPITLDKLL